MNTWTKVMIRSRVFAVRLSMRYVHAWLCSLDLRFACVAFENMVASRSSRIHIGIRS